MSQNLISWMMSGGDETKDDLQMRQHVVALREAAATRASRHLGLGDLRDFVARWNARTTPASEPALDCCAA